jgi:hypothetical protein
MHPAIPVVYFLSGMPNDRKVHRNPYSVTPAIYGCLYSKSVLPDYSQRFARLQGGIPPLVEVYLEML